MKKLLASAFVGFIVLVSQFSVTATAETPNYNNQNYFAESQYEPFTEPPSPTHEPTEPPDTCWDCEGSTMNHEEARAIYCAPAFIEEHPNTLHYCFPEKWAWVCFPDGHCEMYRRDLDPLGIFVAETPAPTATPTVAEETTAP